MHKIHFIYNPNVLTERYSFLRIGVFSLVPVPTVPYGKTGDQKLFDVADPTGWVVQLPFANRFSLANSNYSGILTFS